MKKITFSIMIAILFTTVFCSATDFTVNSFIDAVDSAIGNGVCASAAAECTLRAAIQEANFFDDEDTIVLAAGTYTLTIIGAGEDSSATGDLDITNPITINGVLGATAHIDGNGAVTQDRVFEIHKGPVNFIRLNITGGRVDGDGGCIRNSDTLEFGPGEVSNCEATGIAGFGGGIASTSDSYLGLEFVTIAHNTAEISAGGVIVNGESGMYEVTFTGNSATNTAGLRINTTGTLQMYRSTFSANAPTALLNIGNSDIVWSTFYNNTSTTSAGAISNLGTLNMRNCTISGNSTSQSGGGIQNAPGATATLNNVTIAENTAALGGGIYADGTVNLENTLVGLNTNVSASQPSDCSGTLNSNGNNLIGSLNGCTVSGDETGNVYNVDPLLGPLGYHGGAAFTRLLRSASPAVDAGNDATCETHDQRDVQRPQFASCDIGAVEARVEFTLDCVPEVISASPGSDGVTTCTVTSYQGFNSEVTQNCFGLPAGSTCSFNPDDVTPPADGTALSTLTISTGNTPEGTYVFNVTGVGGLTFDSQILTLVISDAIFLDDFEDNDASNWTFTKGTWNASNGELTGSVARKGDARTPDFGGCVNCAIEADVEMDSDARVSILGWYQDNKNLVEVRLMEDKNRVLLKQRSGGATVTKEKAITQINPATIYNIRVEFDGTQFEVFLDGISLFTIPAGAQPQGNAGFRIKSATGDPVTASFDGIRIE